jgi:hypothetical protein
MKMREVSHAAGQLRFRVPAGWTTIEEGDAAAAFYDQAQATATLRVKLMTFTTEQDLSGPVAYRELEAMEAAPGQKLESLPDGTALRTHREEAVIDGERTLVHVWLLASVVPPRRMLLAVFSFTELADQRDEMMVARLDQEIRRAQFGSEVS